MKACDFIGWNLDMSSEVLDNVVVYPWFQIIYYMHVVEASEHDVYNHTPLLVSHFFCTGQVGQCTE